MSNNIMKYVVPVRRRPRRLVRKRRPIVRRRVNRRRTNRPYTKVLRQPAPDKLFTKLKYSEAIQYNLSTSGVLYDYVFQSSIYDPDFTATGHQPLWRDQYAAMYNNYRVNGIAYKIFWKNTNINQMVIGLIQHSTVTTSDTDVNTLIERGTTRKFMLDSLNGRTNMTKGYLSVAKSYGMSRDQFNSDDGFDAAIGANPTKMAYLHLYTLMRHTSAIVQAQIELTYYVEFFNRINVVGS